jgi:8-oxo-dGDP phosphatase
MERLLAFQPMVAIVDGENLIYLAHGAQYMGDPSDINEAERIAWIDFDEIMPLIQRGEIVGSSSVVALLAVLNRDR